jgi:MoaA/NifB/PqqE/SkfB family radical SAM enzyme
MNHENQQNLSPDIREHGVPTDILIETTTFCNLQCIMCPYKNLTRKKGEMSRTLWCKIIDEVAMCMPDTIVWPAIMGEPLLMGGKLFDFIAYAKQAGVKKIHLNSNFTLFDQALSEQLFASGLDAIFISVDAATERTYKRIRVGGEFERLQHNIELLIRDRKRLGSTLKIHLVFINQKENEHEKQQFIDYWVDKKVNVILKICERLSWGGSVEPGEKIALSSRSVEQRHPCSWLMRQMSVLWNGDVPFCDSPNDTIVGNVSNDSLTDMWNGPLKLIRQRQMQGDFAMTPCNRCSDWNCGRSTFIQA